MRALPFNKSQRPGGRPRNKRAPHSAFSEWVFKGKISAADLAKKLGISTSSLYNLKNGFYLPGRELAVKIDEISKGAVSVNSWSDVKPRPRGKAA